MTVIGWIQILLYCAIIVAITPLLGALHDARFQRRADTSFRRSYGQSRSRSTRLPASTNARNSMP